MNKDFDEWWAEKGNAEFLNLCDDLSHYDAAEAVALSAWKAAVAAAESEP